MELMAGELNEGVGPDEAQRAAHLNGTGGIRLANLRFYIPETVGPQLGRSERRPAEPGL